MREDARPEKTGGTLLPEKQPLAGPGEEPGTGPELRHAPRPHAGTIVLAIALALAGFIAAAALLHLFLRNPLYLHADMRSGKLQMMDAWKGQAFSAIFGSSHLHNGFDPRVFDATLQGTPLSTRTLNLAIEGGSQSEQRVMALQFVNTLSAPAKAQPQSCMVVLELNAGANFTGDQLVHPRAINIYDWPTTRFIASLSTPGMSRQQRTGRIGFAYAAMLMHAINLGMLSNRIFASGLPDPFYATETQQDRRGFLPVTVSTQQQIQEKIDRSPKTLLRIPEEILPGNISLAEELQTSSPVRGLQPVYVVMPKLSDLHSYPIYPEMLKTRNSNVPIVNLARPDLYPELYAAENWADEAHLNERGAHLASTLLANALKKFYTDHPITARCGG